MTTSTKPLILKGVACQGEGLLRRSQRATLFPKPNEIFSFGSSHRLVR